MESAGSRPTRENGGVLKECGFAEIKSGFGTEIGKKRNFGSTRTVVIEGTRGGVTARRFL